MAIAEPPEIESVEPDALGASPPRPGRKGLSMTPGAIRARAFRANRKNGSAPGDGKPQRTTRRSGGKSRMPRTPKTLYPEISAFLMMANTLVKLSPVGTKSEPTGNVTMTEVMPGITIPLPEMRVVKLGDELDELEIAHLAKSLDAQCQRSPRFKKYVESVLGVAAGGGVVAVLGIIAARRAARHGLIDPAMDGTLAAFLQGDLGSLAAFQPTPAPDDTPDPVTGETAPVPGSDATSFDEL